MPTKTIFMQTSLKLGLLCLLAFFQSTSFTQAQIIINEYSCSNDTEYIDGFGENEDWIELYNTSGSAIDMTGMYLSDKADKGKREQGCCTVFPSYVLHQVTPVTKGTRYSLVAWIGGPDFK